VYENGTVRYNEDNFVKTENVLVLGCEYCELYNDISI